MTDSDIADAWWATQCKRCQQWNSVRYAGTAPADNMAALGNPPRNIAVTLCLNCGEPLICSPDKLQARKGPHPDSPGLRK